MFDFPIVIRMDDICPYMNILKFNKYIEMFETFGIKPLLGVIPDCRDINFTFPEIKNFWDIIKQKEIQGYSIAMHGVHHVYTSKSKGIICNRNKSEFAGILYEKQYELLKTGLDIFLNNNILVDTFMPPGHSYDENTLKALFVLGFRYLTDARSFWPYVSHGIKCIPTNASYRLHFNRGMLTICVHSETEDDSSFEKLYLFIKKNYKKIIDWSIAKQIKNHNIVISRIEEKININIDKILSLMLSITK